ncbi:MAG: protoporphyrinogen oxidase [Alphaproteobacteria bacterium]
MTADVVVIGAGISGLSTAHHLVAGGHDVIVLERRVGVGGNAVSERIGGYLMEHGPSTINAAVPEALDMTSQLELDESRVNLGDAVRRRYLVDGDRLAGIALHRAGFLSSNYLSLRGRLLVLAEITRRRREGGGEESVHDFVARRFGREFATRVMEPLVAGLFAGDAHAVSVSAVFPKLVEFEQHHGSITRALLRARGGSDPSNRLYSWPDGIATLPLRLAHGLGPRIRTGVAVTRLTRTADGYDIQTPSGGLRTRAVVLAVQPHVAAALLETVDPAAADAAGAIAAPPLSTVYFGFKRAQVDHPLDGVGYLSARGENRVVSGVQFCSTMFPGRAPPDCVSLSAYVGGARHPELARLSAEELIPLVQADIADLLGVHGAPEICRVRHWSRGLPQYAIGHTDRVRALQGSDDRVSGLFVTGNFMQGVSVGHCLTAARRTAGRVDQHLSRTTAVGRSATRQAGTG